MIWCVLRTQRPLQELSLLASIPLEVGTSIPIEMATGDDMKFLRLTSTRKSLDSNVRRGQQIRLRNRHQQRRWSDSMNHA